MDEVKTTRQDDPKASESGTLELAGIKQVRYHGNDMLVIIDYETELEYSYEWTDLRRILGAYTAYASKIPRIQDLVLNYVTLIFDFDNGRVHAQKTKDSFTRVAKALSDAASRGPDTASSLTDSDLQKLFEEV